VDVSPENRAIRIAPDTENPYSWRDFCPKGRTAAQLVEHPRRIVAPMKRVGDGYVETSWDEALSDIASRLTAIRDHHGPNAIGFYWGNPAGLSGSAAVFLNALMDAIGTHNRYFVGSVDQNNLHVVGEQMYGSPVMSLVPDVDACRCFLLIGMNPAHSAMNWLWNVPDGWKRVLAAQADGADLIVVDPIRTATAARADTHLRVTPGQDWALLLALLKVVFEKSWEHREDCDRLDGIDEVRRLAREADLADLSARCGIDAEVIRDVAYRFANAPTAMCVTQTGVAQNATGTIGEWLCQLLNLVTGRVDRPGGRRYERGYVNNAALVALSTPATSTRSRLRDLPTVLGHHSLAELADEITTPGDGQIKAMVVYAGNPVVSGPDGAALDEAFAGLDLLIAVDLIQRESHRHAHWLLPGEHWLEREDLLPLVSGMQDRGFVQFGPQALEPPAGVRPEWRTFTDLAIAMKLPLFGKHGTNTFVRATRWLAKRSGRPQLEFNPRWVSRALVAAGRTVRWKDILAHPHGWVFREPTFGHFWSSLRTPDKKVRAAPPEFLAETRGRLATPRPTPSLEYPFILSNRRHRESMNSWLNDLPGLHRRDRDSRLEIHPDDADRIGVRTGDTVAVRSSVNAVEFLVDVSEDPSPGVVIASHGWGSGVFDPRGGGAPQRHGVNRNLLIPNTEIDPFSHTPALNSTYVQVVRSVTT
jgi:formate dehydrogenase